jgi:hypothetical protein
MVKPPETGAPAHVGQMKVWTALGGSNSGIVGNRLHDYGFHRGASYVPADDYSRRRDPNGSDGPYSGWGLCCAGDYRHGGKKVLRARHAVLLTRLMDNDPTLSNVCEFIGQPWPDRPVYYWARWNGVRLLQRYLGQGHDLWSHVSVWRSDADDEPQLWTPASESTGGAGGGLVVPVKRPTTLKAPPWPKGATYFGARDNAPVYITVRVWEARMRQRGWPIKVNGRLTEADGDILAAFQKEKGLRADRRLGPKSFAAAWTSKVT